MNIIEIMARAIQSEIADMPQNVLEYSKVPTKYSVNIGAAVIISKTILEALEAAGYVVAPREPTHEMILSALFEKDPNKWGSHSMFNDCYDMKKTSYKQMLEARPKI